MPIIDTQAKPAKVGDVSITTLDTIRKHVGSGGIALPEFQRPQVWNTQERKELVISLCLGVPIGSFLLWEYDASVQTDTEIIEFPGISTTKDQVEYLLIDGQQRMTTISQLTTSDFGKSYKVEFRKISDDLTRPVIHKIAKVEGKKQYEPDLSTINRTREMQIAELAGHSNIIDLDKDAKEVALKFRASMNSTNIPIHVFSKKDSRQWVVYVYQTCNLAGKPLSDTDHAEAALGYVYPEIKDKISNYTAKVKLWDAKISDIPRKLILRSILDELYKSPHFRTCKDTGLDVLDPRVIKEKANQKTGKDEQSDPLTKQLVKAAFDLTRKAFSKLEDLFISSWQIPHGGGKILLENEMLIMLAWWREHQKNKTKPSAAEIGKMSKHMMLSMALKPTSGGSTQSMTVNACNTVRESTSTCWDKIQSEWGYRLLEYKDLGKTDYEVSQISHESLIFHLFKLTLYRNPDAMDLFDSSSITAATTGIQIDHFYPKSKLGLISGDFSLTKRRNHLGNFVVMKQWSNNNKKDEIPNDFIEQKSLWPVGDKKKNSNFSAHCIPRKYNSTKWIPNGKQKFDELKALRKEIAALRRKSKSKTATEADVKVWTASVKTNEIKADKISRTLSINYIQFIEKRSKDIVNNINEMLTGIEKIGF